MLECLGCGLYTSAAYTRVFTVLNSILFTDVKLHKIGFKESNLCSFCETVPETLHHLLWLSLMNGKIQLSLQDVVVGIISSQNSSLLTLLNFFIIIGKLYLWDCRRLQDLQRFKVKLKMKYEIERFISLKNNNDIFFKKKWIFFILFVIQLSRSVYVYMYMYICMCTCIYMYIYRYVHVYMGIYVNACM